MNLYAHPFPALLGSLGATTISAASLAAVSSWSGIAFGLVGTVVAIAALFGWRPKRALVLLPPPPTPPMGVNGQPPDADEWDDYCVRIDQYWKDHGVVK